MQAFLHHEAVADEQGVQSSLKVVLNCIVELLLNTEWLSQIDNFHYIALLPHILIDFFLNGFVQLLPVFNEHN